jgi:hypothetical protein
MLLRLLVLLWYVADASPLAKASFPNLISQAITGKQDYIICDGECEGIFEEPARSLFKNANFTPYLHPDASHNFNFHRNATGAYKVITDFLVSNGL